MDNVLYKMWEIRRGKFHRLTGFLKVKTVDYIYLCIVIKFKIESMVDAVLMDQVYCARCISMVGGVCSYYIWDGTYRMDPECGCN